mmetsp:Transcript_9411/g.16165  ORF Transcript_9411/g.16165 Transcript_9411/m.16165 type:complete len:176 (+) Transcript_9411:142-669(+)|eukprot:CAMPEP_0198210376 /NCGR_PEP_ID=MMETSP1445-20131203/20067_1 /TAXON_ID=36898 /ORGANISM="Pyramimonas sp., Strain CCMP2087" /LENGTH=175 /DNA_ID=CAMNT_0043884421 /DNA_START=141 /DNA_END=668 /DNA_ORIENTATION=+
MVSEELRTPGARGARTPGKGADGDSPRFIGVRPMRSGFKAEITIKGEKRDCGVHSTAEDAARARDAEAIKEGVKRLNFPADEISDTPTKKTPAKTLAKTPVKTPVKSPGLTPAKSPFGSPFTTPIRTDSPETLAVEEETEAAPSPLKKLIWVLMPCIVMLIAFYLQRLPNSVQVL